MASFVLSDFGRDLDFKIRSQSDCVSCINAPKLSFKKSRNNIPFLDLDGSNLLRSDGMRFHNRRNAIDKKMKAIYLNYFKTYTQKVGDASAFTKDKPRVINICKKKKEERKSILSALSRSLK